MVSESLSLVSPCYNEKGNIRRFVMDWHKELSSRLKDFEIIVVDDCSTDETPEILAELSRTIPQLVVIRNVKNSRHGASLINGFRRAKKDFILWTDSDYSHYPKDIWKLWELRKDYDAVWGFGSPLTGIQSFEYSLRWATC